MIDPQMQAILRPITVSEFHPGIEFTVFSFGYETGKVNWADFCDNIRIVERWCRDNFGDPMVFLQPFRINTDRKRWYMSSGQLFYFKDKTDATLFKLQFG